VFQIEKLDFSLEQDLQYFSSKIEELLLEIKLSQIKSMEKNV